VAHSTGVALVGKSVPGSSEPCCRVLGTVSLGSLEPDTVGRKPVAVVGNWEPGISADGKGLECKGLECKGLDGKGLGNSADRSCVVGSRAAGCSTDSDSFRSFDTDNSLRQN